VCQSASAPREGGKSARASLARVFFLLSKNAALPLPNAGRPSALAPHPTPHGAASIQPLASGSRSGWVEGRAGPGGPTKACCPRARVCV
jgi:hypothetical protein